MSSPKMKIRCPNCQKDGSARAELLNRRVSCKHCAHVFRAVPIDDAASAQAALTRVLPGQAVTEATEPARASTDRIESLEREIRRLRDDLRAEAAKFQSTRDQLARALDAARDGETRERGLREEVERLRDQLDQTEVGAGGEPRDRLREEELRFLRDQLDRARAEVESEARKRREASATLAARVAEHAKALEAQDAEFSTSLASKEAEHARAFREAREQLDRLKAEAQAVEARRLAADSARAAAEGRQADELHALRGELGRTREELDGARKALGELHLGRDRQAAEHARALDELRFGRDRQVAEHARALDELRGQVAGLEARLAEADAVLADRDRLAEALEANRSRLAEAERSALDRKAVAEGLRLELDRLEAARSAEQASLREELEAARAGRSDVDVAAVILERDEALAMRDRLIEEVEKLRAELGEAQGISFDWVNNSTELEMPNMNADVPTEAEVPVMVTESPTLHDGGAGSIGVVTDDPTGVLSFEDAPPVVDGDPSSMSFLDAVRLADRGQHDADSLRAELERARAEAEEASRRNRELAERIRVLEETSRPASAVAPEAPRASSPPPPEVDLDWLEAERKRAVDEAIKGAWADFERRLSETQAKLKAANARADLMEIEAREAREQSGRDPGDSSGFGESRSMTSIRILDSRGTPRLTLADAEARLSLARQMAVDRKDKALIDRIAKLTDKVRADLEDRNYTLAESLVRGAEIETGLDPGGYSIAGLRIFRPSPTVVGSLTALGPAFERAMRQGELATVRKAIDEMKTILGDQAGLPELRRAGRTPAVKRPISEGEALRLFVAALEAENWLIRPIAAKKLPPDTALTTYACLVEACCEARKVAAIHAPERQELLDGVIQASCLMMTRRQQADGHFSFLDPRGRASKPASAVEAMVAQRPDSVKDGWVVLVDPLGIAQVETGACALALSVAGKDLGRPEWSQASRKAADWAMDQPCLTNFVANAASASLLARAFLDVAQDRYLAGLARKLTIGLLPGQVQNGRWIDPSAATTPNHLVIVRALHDSWEAIPADRQDLRGDLKPAVDRAMSSLLSECQALGVPSQGSGLRDLIRHRDLFGPASDPRLEPAIIDSATVIQGLCHDGPKPKLGVAPDQLAALIRAS